MLENLKMLLNISDNTKDDLLTFLIEQAREEAMAAPDIPSPPTIIRI